MNVCSIERDAVLVVVVVYPIVVLHHFFDVFGNFDNHDLIAAVGERCSNAREARVASSLNGS